MSCPVAVEVVSPNEGASDLRDKIVDYLSEGAEQVWVAYPTRKEIHVYTGTKGENVRIYSENHILEAETLFPDLKISVAEYFADVTLLPKFAAHQSAYTERKWLCICRCICQIEP